jgi:quinol monooxygenase YgiN
MKNILKVLALSIPLITSCAINNYPTQINNEEFETAKKIVNKKPNFGIFLDLGEKGKLDEQDVLILNTEKGTILYTLRGAWNANKNEIYSPWEERNKLMKHFSTEYFNNLKDFEQQRKEQREKLEDKK